ncbi:MAG: HU-CCDC81 and SPOR domain-containing protein [Flavobacteriales bacterium]|nr:HU-CCDC81 and SPOR domain-containing protein [Flavobacteriales bacterium]
MGLERDLHDLLFCHDCVIVPQWGGFITHYRAARLDEARKIIHPPGKELSFNRHLVRNDGLLADRLARREGIAFDKASARIDAEVAGWRSTLDRNGRLELPYIGIFFRDAEHNLQFDPDRRSNYLKDAFGLRSLAAVPVEQPITQPVVVPITKKEPVAQEERRSSVLWVAAGVAAVLFSAAAFWAYRMQDGDQVQWSGFGPWAARPAAHYKAPEQAGFAPVSTPLPFELPSADSGVHEVLLDAERDVRVHVRMGDLRIATADTTHVAVRIAPPPASADLRFHVIGGCFAQPENADKLLEELLAKGFPARRLRQRGMLHPVAFGSYATRAEALTAMDQVRHTEGRSAWLLVR